MLHLQLKMRIRKLSTLFLLVGAGVAGDLFLWLLKKTRKIVIFPGG